MRADASPAQRENTSSPTGTAPAVVTARAPEFRSRTPTQAITGPRAASEFTAAARKRIRWNEVTRLVVEQQGAPANCHSDRAEVVVGLAGEHVKHPPYPLDPSADGGGENSRKHRGDATCSRVGATTENRIALRAALQIPTERRRRGHGPRSPPQPVPWRGVSLRPDYRDASVDDRSTQPSRWRPVSGRASLGIAMCDDRSSVKPSAADLPQPPTSAARPVVRFGRVASRQA